MKISQLSRYALSFCTATTMLAGCGGAQPQSPLLTLPNSTAQLRPAVPQLHDGIRTAVSPLRSEPAGQIKGHLYVAGSSGSSSTVERFRIVDGVPESKPDRTYSGVGSPIAVDSHGYLYATIENAPACGSGQATGADLIAYAPNSNSPVRTLEVNAGLGFDWVLGISSLFVDPQGYVYVGVNIVEINGSGVGWAVNVYRRRASGCAPPPIQTFDSGNCNEFHGLCGYTLAGLAMDAQGNLHVSNNGSGSSENTVLSFASPITDPTQIAALTGSGIVSPRGLAIDVSDELYVDNAQGASSFVAAYPATANGNPKPSRKISVSGAQSFANGIAVAAGRLIIPDYIADAVYEVRTTRHGSQMPIWTLALPSGFSPRDVKLGP